MARLPEQARQQHELLQAHFQQHNVSPALSITEIAEKAGEWRKIGSGGTPKPTQPGKFYGNVSANGDWKWFSDDPEGQVEKSEEKQDLLSLRRTPSQSLQEVLLKKRELQELQSLFTGLPDQAGAAILGFAFHSTQMSGFGSKALRLLKTQTASFNVQPGIWVTNEENPDCTGWYVERSSDDGMPLWCERDFIKDPNSESSIAKAQKSFSKAHNGRCWYEQDQPNASKTTAFQTRLGRKTCDNGHELIRTANRGSKFCDVCDGSDLPRGSSYHCQQCDYDACPKCYAGETEECRAIARHTINFMGAWWALYDSNGSPLYFAHWTAPRPAINMWKTHRAADRRDVAMRLKLYCMPPVLGDDGPRDSVAEFLRGIQEESQRKPYQNVTRVSQL